MAKLPNELTDCVIDFHHSDPRALAACSLVCKTWLPASRHHLFQTLSITPRNVQSFIELLKSPRLTIANHPRVFGITLTEYGGLLDKIAPYLDRFIAVKSLRMWGSWGPPGEEQEENVFGWFAGIRDLNISTLHFRRSYCFFKLVASFHSLESLGLDGATLDFMTDDVCNSFTVPLPPSLNALSFRFCYGRDPVSSLLAIARSCTLTEVKLLDIRLPNINYVQCLLRSLGHSVQKLKLCLISCASVALLFNKSII
jgi:hypothetical protein